MLRYIFLQSNYDKGLIASRDSNIYILSNSTLLLFQNVYCSKFQVLEVKRPSVEIKTGKFIIINKGIRVKEYSLPRDYFISLSFDIKELNSLDIYEDSIDNSYNLIWNPYSLEQPLDIFHITFISRSTVLNAKTFFPELYKIKNSLQLLTSIIPKFKEEFECIDL